MAHIINFEEQKRARSERAIRHALLSIIAAIVMGTASTWLGN